MRNHTIFNLFMSYLLLSIYIFSKLSISTNNKEFAHFHLMFKSLNFLLIKFNIFFALNLISNLLFEFYRFCLTFGTFCDKKRKEKKKKMCVVVFLFLFFFVCFVLFCFVLFLFFVFCFCFCFLFFFKTNNSANQNNTAVHASDLPALVCHQTKLMGVLLLGYTSKTKKKTSSPNFYLCCFVVRQYK